MIGTTNVEENDEIYSAVYMDGGGDATYGSWIPFNTVIHNIGGGTWTNGHYIVPKAGYYFCSFTNYSNGQGSGRVAIAHLGPNGEESSLERSMCNCNYTASVTDIYKCEKGD